MNKIVVIIIAAVLILLTVTFLFTGTAPTFPWGDNDTVSGTATINTYIVTTDGRTIDISAFGNPMAVLYQGYAVSAFQVYVCVEGTDNSNGQYPQSRIASHGSSTPHIRVDFDIVDNNDPTKTYSYYGWFNTDAQGEITDTNGDNTPTCFNGPISIDATSIEAAGITGDATMTTTTSGDFEWWGLDSAGNIKIGPYTSSVPSPVVSTYDIYVGDGVTFTWSDNMAPN